LNENGERGDACAREDIVSEWPLTWTLRDTCQTICRIYKNLNTAINSTTTGESLVPHQLLGAAYRNASQEFQQVYLKYVSEHVERIYASLHSSKQEFFTLQFLALTLEECKSALDSLVDSIRHSPDQQHTLRLLILVLTRQSTDQTRRFKWETNKLTWTLTADSKRDSYIYNELTQLNRLVTVKTLDEMCDFGYVVGLAEISSLVDDAEWRDRVAKYMVFNDLKVETCVAREWGVECVEERLADVSVSMEWDHKVISSVQWSVVQFKPVRKTSLSKDDVLEKRKHLQGLKERDPLHTQMLYQLAPETTVTVPACESDCGFDWRVLDNLVQLHNTKHQ
jgi:hypothetical protein